MAASVLVSVRSEGGGQSGSGTVILVDESKSGSLLALILTNRHVCEQKGRDPKRATISVAFTSGATKPATFVAWDDRADLACVIINADRSTPYIPLASRGPVAGDAVCQVGYPSGRLTQRAGKILGFRNTTGPRILVPSFQIASGDSGSGVFFVAERALCGVMWGSTVPANEACGVEWSDCKRFVETCLFWKKKPQPSPVSPAQPPAQPSPAQPSPVLDDLQGRVAALEKKVSDLPDQLAARIAAKVGEVHAAASGKSDALESKVKDVAGGLDRLAERVKQLPIPADKAAEAANWGATLLPWLAGGAATGGVGVPLALGGMALLRMLGGATKTQPSPAAPAYQNPVIVSGAVPPQVTKIVSDYVPVEVPSPELAAYKQALDEIAKRHPGALDTIETIRQYARQIESGQTSKR